MTSAVGWSSGDRLIHAGKPEWGTGTVVKAEWTTHEGKKCQRVTVRFARAGLKTVSTAFATLEASGGAARIDAARDSVKSALARDAEPVAAARPKRPPPGMLGAAEAPPDEGPPLDAAAARVIMTAIPEAARDPFKPVAERVRATLGLFKYGSEGGPLLDWATAQSGLNDPLSVFSRPDLEQLFDRFRINRDQHLASLLTEARRQGVDLTALLRDVPPAARRVVNDLNHRR